MKNLKLFFALCLMILFISGIMLSQTNGDYRSKTSGNWGDASTWEVYNDGWGDATTPPTSSDGVITIMSGHNVNVTASVTVDQVVINTGGTITVNSGQILTIADGAGTDLTVNGNLYNSGTVSLSPNVTVIFNNGSKYTHNVDDANVPKSVSASNIAVTWQPNSTVEITGWTTVSGKSGTFTSTPATTWGNVVFNFGGTMGNNINFGSPSGLSNIAGNLVIKNPGTTTLRFLPSGQSNQTINLQGDFILESGTFQYCGGTSTGCSWNIGGNWIQTGGTYSANVGSGNTLAMNFTGANKTFIQSSGTFTITGLAITVKSGASLDIQSYSNFSGTGTSFTIESNAQVKQGGSGTAPPGTFTTRTYASNSTYIFYGTQAGLSGTHPTYGNLIFEPSPTGNGTFALNLSVVGNLTINLGTAYEIRLATGSTSRTHSIGGNLVIQGNSIVVGSNGDAAGFATITVGGDLNIASGTLRGTNEAGNATFNIAGNIINNGTWQQDDGTSTGIFTINLNGSSSQDISGVNAISFEDLTINNSNGATLSRSVDVTGTLTLSNGRLSLGNNNLTVSGSISGGSASSYIATTGTGVLTRNNVGNTNVLFPVGTASSYNPITINNAGTADNFSVRVKSTFDNTPIDPNKVVNRQWTITEATPGGSDATITFQWNAADEATYFDRTAGIEVGRWAGTQWIGLPAVYLGGSDPFSAYIGNISDFSDFAVGNSYALPIQLSSFIGNVIASGKVKLEWETISEINNLGFYVEKFNQDINDFVTVSELIPGAGTTLQPQRYSWIDENAVESNLQYRLKQVDMNGLSSYFGPIMLNPNSVIDNVPAVFELKQNYPNPFNPVTTISFSLAEANYTTLKVYNIVGSEVATLYEGNAEAGKLYSVKFNGSNLSSGVYLYKLQSGKNVEVRKFTLMK